MKPEITTPKQILQKPDLTASRNITNLYPIKPFHERWQNYIKTRKKIFKRSRSAQRARSYWENVRLKKDFLVSAKTQIYDHTHPFKF